MSTKQPKEVRVEAIIDAAVEEFLQKGYNGASVDSIAKRAGVSKGGFYHHFENKEVVLMEANQKLSKPIELLAVQVLEEPSAMVGLHRYIREYLTYWANRPKELSFFFLSMAKSLESEMLMDYYRSYMQSTTDFFTYLFQKANDNQEANYEDPQMMGITLMGALDGVMTYLIVNPDVDIDSLVARLECVWGIKVGGAQYE